ncbi:STM3941 family protein [Paenibacillus sp. JCM 10914]
MKFNTSSFIHIYEEWERLLGQDEIRVYPKVGKLFIGSLVFVVIGIVMMYAGGSDEENNVFIVVVGAICTLFFGFGFVYAISKLLQRKPALLINQTGIEDHSSLVSSGFVTWDEIKGIDMYQVQNQRFIGIEVHHPEQIWSRHPHWKQRLMRLNKGMTDSAIHIQETGLSGNFNELFLVMYRRWKLNKSDELEEREEEHQT